MSERTHSPHSGVRARHILRPWRMSRRLSVPHSSGGTRAPISLSTLTGSVCVVRPKPTGEAPHVGVDREPGQAHGHAAHHVGGLAAHPGQAGEVLHRGRHLTAEALGHAPGHAHEVLGLRAEEPRGPHALLEVLDRAPRRGLRVSGTPRTDRASPCSPARRCTGPRGSSPREAGTAPSWWSAHSSAALPGYSTGEACHHLAPPGRAGSGDGPRRHSTETADEAGLVGGRQARCR